MNIAITAANGQLGALVIRELLKRGPGENLIAISRKPVSVPGVESRTADYEDEGSYENALQGVDTLLLISSSEVGKRLGQHSNVIRAAKKAGVKHIVYTSLLRADSSPLSLAEEHKATEDFLAETGIPTTLLRNGWYLENHTGSLAQSVAAGAILGSAGDGRISSAPRADYAEAAAVVLTTEGHVGKTYELAGDSSYTLAELASETAKQSGKPVAYVNLPEKEYAEKLVGFGLPDGLAAAIASWDTGISQGGLFDEGHVLSGLIGHPTGTLEDGVRSALA